ncbi:MAG TPA: hypothetical protein PKE64_14125, partial [Anaerolineae bacterium]|nr:hypothetical protein [Anaerolineae bacterium]
DWQERRVRFTVDNYPVLDCDTSPRGPLGFVLWLDNQYMVVTPWGKLGYGLVAGDSQQWLEISQLEIESE